LFICREIVERHGGSIWAESEGAQQGSCFHVKLPRTLPQIATPPGPTASTGLSSHQAA
jgi:signal transduction histidine kinase